MSSKEDNTIHSETTSTHLQYLSEERYFSRPDENRLLINDRIATQRYLTPEIPIGSPVMSRTTSEPSDGRSRKMVANVAGCRSFRTFRDCHTMIPALHSRLSDRNQIWHTYSDGYVTDSNLIFFDTPDPRGVPGGILGGQKFKSPGNVMNCPENQ